MSGEELGAVGAFSDGISSGDWISAASTLLKGFGGAGSSAPVSAPVGPAESMQRNNYAWDNSGFAVNTGPGSTSAGVASDLPSWVYPALVALGMLVWLKSSKKK